MAKSRVACNSFNIGSSTTISITRDKSSYTHTIKYKFGSAVGTIEAKTSETTIAWNPTASTLYNQIPNANSGYGTITCETFDGNTSLGTTTAGFYAYAVKNECLPSVTATIEDTNASTIDVTGSSSKFVNYISKPKVTVTATPKNSSTIKTINIDNVGLIATSSPYTFSTMYDKYFKVTATDSRGYSTTTPYEVDMVDYIPCHLTTVSLDRLETTSTTAKLEVNGYCFKGSFGKESNTLTIEYKYKTENGNYGDAVTVSASEWKDDGSFKASTNVPNLSTSEQYIFEITVRDRLTSFGDGEEILLVQSIGDLRIAKNYVMTKNNVIVGDKDNEDWRCFKARRKRDGINYDVNFGAGFGGGGISAVMEVNQVENGVETKVARFDLMKDGYLYNWFSNMSVAEINSFAPSIVAGGTQGRLLLNGGNVDPILIQWGRVSITPTTANATIKSPIKFVWGYQGVPAVFTEMSTSAPATIDISAGDVTATGFNIYLQRTNTVATSIMWWAIGNGTPSLPE
jgi:hypothetical protein